MAEYIDKAQVQTELMMNAERYTIAHESGGFGTVEWSDKLIPVWKVTEILRNMPSIEDVPVVHGRWIRDEFGTKCGACGLYAYRDKFGQPWESPYCPNCGSRNRGENEE